VLVMRPNDWMKTQSETALAELGAIP